MYNYMLTDNLNSDCNKSNIGSGIVFCKIKENNYIPSLKT